MLKIEALLLFQNVMINTNYTYIYVYVYEKKETKMVKLINFSLRSEFKKIFKKNDTLLRYIFFDEFIIYHVTLWFKIFTQYT
jgi:hypothetical protein